MTPRTAEDLALDASPTRQHLSAGSVGRVLVVAGLLAGGAAGAAIGLLYALDDDGSRAEVLLYALLGLTSGAVIGMILMLPPIAPVVALLGRARPWRALAVGALTGGLSASLVLGALSAFALWWPALLGLSTAAAIVAAVSSAVASHRASGEPASDQRGVRAGLDLPRCGHLTGIRGVLRPRRLRRRQRDDGRPVATSSFLCGADEVSATERALARTHC